MCGIAGGIAGAQGSRFIERIAEATDCMASRGPDDRGHKVFGRLALGHRRLSVIDTSAAASQPMQDATGRYVIVFNGEFFNYREHREFVLSKGCTLRTRSDTEVLLNLYLLEGERCLQRVNGFFALAIYDTREKTLFLARDRFGVKPLYLFEDGDSFLFASEMKALIRFGIPREPDPASLHIYLQLNYIPPPYSIFRQVRKMMPGTYILYDAGKNKLVREASFFDISPEAPETAPSSYADAGNRLHELMDASVRRRLVSDVPLGAFLSGGLDSSIVSALAARHTDKLRTFSIGFPREPYYDETPFARKVAKHLGTDHTVFDVGNRDLFGILYDVLDYTDEPFADSSALNVYILSRHTRREVTVALSGDGGDELFAGYHKHRAEWIIRNRQLFTATLRNLYPLLKHLHGGRGGSMANRIRQAQRFADGARMNARDRYWRWCALAGEAEADRMMQTPAGSSGEYIKRKQLLTSWIGDGTDLNGTLLNDVKMILPGDMLTKVDLMSMAHSLEVRTPFLDYEVVQHAFHMPAKFKIDAQHQKKILKDAFSRLLPGEILSRGKKGFEVPLLNWFRTDMRDLIEKDLLGDDFIRSQGVFNPAAVRALKQRLFSTYPGEIQGRVWGMVVFQYWWRKYML